MDISAFLHGHGAQRCLRLLCLVLTVWQGPLRAEPASGVLIVTAPGVPGVQPVLQALTTGSVDGGDPRRGPLRVDVRAVMPGQSEEQFAHSLQPELNRYQAVYATSLSLARAVQREDARIPIVFKGEADPVSTCLVDSMHRPGRNATGYIDYLPGDDAKMMEALVYGFPNLRTIYIMVAGSAFYVPDCGPLARDPKPLRPPCVASVREPDADLEWMQETAPVLAEAKRLGVSVKFMLVCRREDFAGFAAIEPGRTDIGFVFALQGLYWREAGALVAQVARARRPAIYGRSMFAQRGGVMALEPILDANDDRAAIDMLLRVLGGRSAATLPVQTPRGFRLTVNASAAAAQGLKPSLSVLRRADFIIAATPR